ncbi:MAG: hypothetical protein ABW215_09440 [Kibdelosporangium sp.]
MSASAELVHDLLAALDGVPGLRPAGLTRAGQTSWVLNWDAMAIDVVHDAGDAGGGQVVVMRVVATRLPLSPVVRQAERTLLAVLAASDLPVTRLCLEITDIDGTAFA